MAFTWSESSRTAGGSWPILEHDARQPITLQLG